ncbi:hypothetical protein P7C73_g3631, partial [Tremellales sp. Uapishka_1]
MSLRSSVNSLLDRSYNALTGAGAVQHQQFTEDGLLGGLDLHDWSEMVTAGGGDGMARARRLLFWVAIIMVLMLFAAITNPTESSFRSHLTELSFRRHLTDLRADDAPPAIEDTLPSSTPLTPDRPRLSRAGTDTPPIAPFRFANHVAISLRTPWLIYTTCFFFSLSLTARPGPPVFLSDPALLSTKGKHAPPMPKERMVVFLGLLGHWLFLGEVPAWVEGACKLFKGRREKGRKKTNAGDRSGVVEMRAIQSKEDASPVGAARSTSTLGQSLAGSKLFLRSDSHTNLTDHNTLPLHTHPAPIPVTVATPESRRPSMANLISTPPPALAESTDLPNSPVLLALKSDLAAAQSTLTDLQKQLLTHEESISDAHSHLQLSVDEIRQRRKDDDAERQELKVKTKSLEEQKRQAEGARREAEKKLKAVEGIRDTLQGKILAALNEMKDLKAGMEGSAKVVKGLKEEGEKSILDIKESVEGKKTELGELECELVVLDGQNEQLGMRVKEAEEKLRTVVEYGRIQPEEEMMMMAAAYEAAANEGYYNQLHGTWANQAASNYMSEAGLDISYDYGQAQRNVSSAIFQHPPSRTPSSKLSTDLSGFEDFGPGAASVHRTPPRSELDYDLGSPSGNLSSSFTANLLPRGLVRSLEGDATPLDDDDDEFQEALPFDLADEPASFLEDAQHESASESGSEEWKSPETKSESRLSSHSRLLPSHPTPPHVPILPAHRWFSSSSSDNLHANSTPFGFHPTTSNDSLASPFAPSASEKKALKWGPLSRYRWSGTQNQNQNQTQAREDESFSRFPRTASLELPHPDGGRKDGEDDDEQGKKSFRFFSLRKQASLVNGNGNFESNGNA